MCELAKREIFMRGGRYLMCQVLTTWRDKPPKYILCNNLENGNLFLATQGMGTWMEVDLEIVVRKLNGELPLGL